MTAILQHLCRTLTLPNEVEISDRELLGSFIASRDEAAFAALVRRHGPMVWRVCRRMLVSHHDAEDAFQATFLVLVRKAASVAPPEMVANWLYGVAHQTARNARASGARRGLRERLFQRLPEPAMAEPKSESDLHLVLDQELHRLPDKYRAAMVLCDLQGRTRKDVARQLGVPEGTLSGHLTRGRAMLAKRLARRGLVMPAAALASALAEHELSAAVPTGLLSATIHGVWLQAAGSAAISARAAVLADSVVRHGLLTKTKAALGVLMLASAAGLATTGIMHSTLSYQSGLTRHEASEGPSPLGQQAPPTAIQPRITFGKETTVLSGPLNNQGDVDYEAALNRELGRGIRVGENANALLWSALGPRRDSGRVLPEYFQRLHLPIPPEHGNYFISPARYASDVLKLKPGASTAAFLAQLHQAARQPWREQSHPAVAAWLKANEKPLAVVIEATRRPAFYNPQVSRKSGAEGWYGLVGALMPGVSECREVAAALVARAMRHTAEANLEAARQDLLACHRLGRLLARRAEPTVYLIGLAIDQLALAADISLLARATPSATEMRTWLRDFEHLPPLPSVADWYDLGGRYMFLDSVLHLHRHGDEFLHVLIAIDPRLQAMAQAANLKPRAGLTVSLDWDLILRTGNRWYDRMAAAHRIPDRAGREQELERIGKDLRALERDAGSLIAVRQDLRAGRETRARLSQRLAEALVGFYQQGFHRVGRAADRAEQGQRNLRLALALATYRTAQGHYPEKLETLAPRYLKEIPGDLFSGQALHYHRLAAGYVLYSVGLNGRDDGGRTSADNPAGDDLGVRIPLPAEKRP